MVLLALFYIPIKVLGYVTILALNVDMANDSRSIFSNDGTALVIHAKPDDMKSDPAGNAGDRIACGLITK